MDLVQTIYVVLIAAILSLAVDKLSKFRIVFPLWRNARISNALAIPHEPQIGLHPMLLVSVPIIYPNQSILVQKPSAV